MNTNHSKNVVILFNPSPASGKVDLRKNIMSVLEHFSIKTDLSELEAFKWLFFINTVSLIPLKSKQIVLVLIYASWSKRYVFVFKETLCPLLQI